MGHWEQYDVEFNQLGIVLEKKKEEAFYDVLRRHKVGLSLMSSGQEDLEAKASALARDLFEVLKKRFQFEVEYTGVGYDPNDPDVCRGIVRLVTVSDDGTIKLD